MRNVLLKRLKKEKSDFLFMVGDVGYRVIEDFQSENPDKYLNTGVNEQLMASFASGVAKSKPCFIYSIANFSTLRCLEQIRNDICLHHAPVCIVSVGGGFGYGALGASHHNLEDVACLGSLPNMQVFNPSSELEVSSCVDYFFIKKKPTYLRLSSLNKECEIDCDKGQKVSVFSNNFIHKENNKILILSSGALISTIRNEILSLKLENKVNLSSVCCLSNETLDHINFKEYSHVYSFEELVYSGSISSLIYKYLYDEKLNINFSAFNVDDYSEIPGGNAEFYRDKYDMSVSKINKFLKKITS